MGVPAESGQPATEENTRYDGDSVQGPHEGRVGDLPERYRRLVDASFDLGPRPTPKVSVVVVTYQTPAEELTETLRMLSRQTTGDFEVVLVDNGTDWPVGEVVRQFDHVSAYVRPQRNVGVTVGRNMGAHLASADLLVFLDDDAVPAEDFLEAHQRAHEGDALGVRGKVLTTEDTFYNRLQSWYDIGDEPRTHYLNIEGNASYDRETFLSVDGFDEALAGRAGHEGIDLTYRLVRDGYDRDRFRYHPDPVIYHDVESDPVSYLRKRVTRRYYRNQLFRRRESLEEFVQSYDRTETGGGELSRSDRLLAHAFGITASLGYRALQLRDAVQRSHEVADPLSRFTDRSG